MVTGRWHDADHRAAPSRRLAISPACHLAGHLASRLATLPTRKAFPAFLRPSRTPLPWVKCGRLVADELVAERRTSIQDRASISGAGDQAGAVQYAQVLGHRTRRDPQAPRELDRGLRLGEQVEQPSPRLAEQLHQRRRTPSRRRGHQGRHAAGRVSRGRGGSSGLNGGAGLCANTDGISSNPRPPANTVCRLIMSSTCSTPSDQRTFGCTSANSSRAPPRPAAEPGTSCPPRAPAGCPARAAGRRPPSTPA